MSTEAQTPEAGAPKKGKPIVLIAAVAVLLLGGGGGAYWWFVARPAAAAAAPAAEHEEEKPKEKPGIVPMEPFVVNLADTEGARYLRVTLALVIDGEEHAKELEENAVEKMRVRSAILELLALQMAEQLTTAEGKAELKKSIAETVGHDVEGVHISDVLFSEFIVQ